MSSNGTKRAVPADTTQFDADSLLRRADRAWANRTADDPAPPEYLAHLAKYLRQHLASGSTPGKAPAAAPPVDDRALAALREQVTAAEQNAAGRRAESDQLRAELADAQAEITRLRAAQTASNDEGERQHLVEVDRMRTRLAELDEALDRARDENADLAERLAEAVDNRSHHAQAVTNLIEERSELVEERDRLRHVVASLSGKLEAALQRVAEAENTEHAHLYPMPDPGGPVLPCECGKPFPRYLEDDPDDAAEIDVDPWSVVFARLRDQLKDIA